MDDPKTLIVVPVFNEWPHAMGILEELRDRFPHILVVEDGSSRRLDRKELKNKGIHYLCLPFNLGSWAAIQTGFKYALIKGYDYVVTFDGDGQHLCEEIPALLQGACQENLDIAVGSCAERASRLRKACWVVLRRLSGVTIEDVTSGFRAYSVRAFKKFAEFSEANIEYQDIGVLLLARRFRLRMGEVPVRMQSRRGGESKVFPNLSSVARYFLITIVSILVKWR